MRVLVATDGSLEPVGAAEAAARLAGPEGTVTLFTAVEVPRRLLDMLRSVYEQSTAGPRVDTDVEYVATPPVEPAPSTSWPGDDTLLSRYVSDETDQRLGSLAGAFRTRGLDPTVKGVESEDPAAAVLAELIEGGYDFLCVGSHGRGRFEGLLGSIGTKLVRQSPVSVVVLRSQAESASR